MKIWMTITRKIMKDCKHAVPYALIDAKGKTRWYCAACDVPIETKDGETAWAKVIDDVLNGPLTPTPCKCDVDKATASEHLKWCPLYEDRSIK